MNHETTAPKPRFNLVCHGMMAFWQLGAERMAILIPDEGDMHYYGIGSVRSENGATSVKQLSPLPAGRAELLGVRPGGMRKEQIREQLQLPVLKTEGVEIVDAQVRTRIDVPMPDRIRCYCGAEASPDAIRGATPVSRFHKVPAVLHDVVVLSWFGFEEGERVRVASDGGGVFPALEGKRGSLRLAIHAQPEVSLRPHPPGHGMGWNRMFRFTDGMQGPDLHLSAPTLIPDAPPRTTAIGLEEDDLLNLIRAAGFVTEQAGCGSGGGSC